ncbi:MAG: hypothetical protein HXX17_07680 [Geobacteraceae bacterium]|nr:hypothetical protein [Geobacteraceae bacterium]
MIASQQSELLSDCMIPLIGNLCQKTVSWKRRSSSKSDRKPDQPEELIGCRCSLTVVIRSQLLFNGMKEVGVIWFVMAGNVMGNTGLKTIKKALISQGFLFLSVLAGLFNGGGAGT